MLSELIDDLVAPGHGVILAMGKGGVGKTTVAAAMAVAIAQRLRPKQTYFTHCSCHIDYAAVNASLPEGIEVGYDGLRIPLS